MTTGLIWQAANLYIAERNDATVNQTAQIKIPEPFNQKTAPLPLAPAKITETVPILMFHYIRDYTNPADPLGIGLSVSPARFEDDLIALKKAGYQTISLDDFAHHRLKPKSIILTFDDGYDSHFTAALPALERQGMIGTFFIVRGFVGQPNYLTREQVTALAAAGMEIGDHTVRHRDLAILPEATQRQEIVGGLLGITANVFAYPSGEYNPITVGILQSIGIEAAVTTKLGVATNLSPPLELPRIRIKQTTDVVKVINDQIYLLKHPAVTPAPTVQ